MTLSHDDPKLTAYVLGELDEADCREIEIAMESSPQLRKAVSEIRTVADALTQQLKAESTPQLDRVRRTEIEAALNGRSDGHRAATANPSPSQGEGRVRVDRTIRIRRLMIPLSLAASVALVFGVVHYGLPELSRSRESSGHLVSATNTKGVGSSARFFLDAGSSAGSGQSVFQGASTGTEDFKKANPSTPGERVAQALPATSSREDRRAARRALAAAGGEGMAEIKRNIEEYQRTSGAGHFSTKQLSSFGYVSGGSQELGVKKPKILFDSVENAYLFEDGDGKPVKARAWLKGSVDDEIAPLADRFYADGMDVIAPAEAYNPVSENPFLTVLREPLSTFSIDVDTASYSNVRRFLQQGTLPPRDAVRIEELINYFDYDYPLPTDEHPFSVNVEVAECPWAPDHRLARIGIKGMEFTERDRPAANLVFLIDVSGSMNQPNKLPLVKQSLELLVNQLRRNDSVAMVVYAGASGLVLAPTAGGNRAAILDAIDRLQSGGSTNAGAGIQLAYDTAIDHFVEGGVNRVILATDGDFNVGIQNREELQRLIEEKAKSGVFLSVLGYGMGNLKDGTVEMLADKGNGNYAYIDTIAEAQKVLVDQMGGTLVTIAKDVKIQVEFNPAEVSSYRLIGYENRMLAAQDFNDDRKDAGEIGAGHTVTALYEIVPAGIDPPDDAPSIDPLKYQIPATQPRSHVATQGEEDQNRDREAEGDQGGSPKVLDDEQDTESEDSIDNRKSQIDNRLSPAAESGELMTVKLRYKEPDEDVSKLIEVPVTDSGAAFADSSDDFAFAASVASFGMLLRQSSYAKLHGANPSEAIDLFDYDFVREVAGDARGQDPFGYRAEFLQLVEKARELSVAAP